MTAKEYMSMDTTYKKKKDRPTHLWRNNVQDVMVERLSQQMKIAARMQEVVPTCLKKKNLYDS